MNQPHTTTTTATIITIVVVVVAANNMLWLLYGVQRHCYYKILFTLLLLLGESIFETPRALRGFEKFFTPMLTR